MAPKKKDRERAAPVADTVVDDKKKKDDKNEVEHSELLKQVPIPFLRSTQLYRMCAVRQATAPLFLHRSLTYMRHRMSRNHERRKLFKVDSILQNKKESQPERPTKYMTITYLGYYDGSINSGEMSTVRVETSIMKRCHNRRKDATVPVVKLCMGTSEVPVNPQEDDDRPVPIMSIPPETINVSTSTVKTRSLVIRVLREARDTKEGREEPFEVTYQVFGAKGQCLLGDATYEAGPGLQDGLWVRLQGPAKDAIVDSTVKAPKISFKLEWTLDARSGWVQRPAPPQTNNAATTARGAECLGDNKENRPAKRGGGSASRSSRPTRAAAAPTALVAAEAEAEGSSTGAAMPPGGNPVTISYNFQYHTGHLNTPFDNRPFSCPWCDLNCVNTYSLFKHLKVCHDRYTFNFTMTDNHVRIDVSLNEQPDTAYEGNPYDLVSVRRHTDVVSRRTVFTRVQVCHPRRPRPSLAEFLEADDAADSEVQRPLITGHDRLYYHTTTCLPVHPREIDQDSEGEKDPKWLQQKTIMMIDDFTDVNEGEKEVIKMWNLHVLKHGYDLQRYVGDCQIPLACSMFVKEKGQELLRKNLYRNFALHLCNLFDFGLLSPPQVYMILRQLREMMRGDPDLVRTARDSWLEQRRSWLASGGAGGPRDKAAQDFPAYDNPSSPSSNPKLSSSSTFITGDGTLRRKMTIQGGKKVKTGTSKQKVVEEDEDEPLELAVGVAGPSDVADRALRKRKLSLQERAGEEPTKRARCGSDPLEAGQTGKSNQPLRRKSTPPGDASKPPLRKSVGP